DEALARELQAIMQREGYYTGEVNGVWDAASIQAFWALVGNENLEGRWSPETTPNQLDKVALDYLRQRFG
ncbi:MAG: fimbrial assembly protein FimA, partial [Phototrophicales bacterium]